MGAWVGSSSRGGWGGWDCRLGRLRGWPGLHPSAVAPGRTRTLGDLAEKGDSPFAIHLHERFARAELLYQLGREDDALPWYRSLAYDLLYTGPAELRQAQIYQRRGDRSRASEHYTRFIQLWRACDPALRPLVQQAREPLADSSS